MKRQWKCARLIGLGCLVALTIVTAVCPQPPKSTDKPPAKDDALPNPRPIDDASILSTWGREPMPIDLGTALRLATNSNLDIARAREVVSQSEAALTRARAIMLPNLGFGTTYINHQGLIQQAIGNILNTNRASLFVGGGPVASFQVNDAIFVPLAARQVVNATQAGFERVTNETMLNVAEAYFNMLRARRRQAAILETIDQLNSNTASPLRAKSKGLLPLVRDFVDVGGKDAFRSDLERVRVEVFRRQQELQLVLQDFRIASAELSRLLRLDPEILLWPVEDFRYPLNLPGDCWTQQEIEELVRFALNNRPELAENQALVNAAVDRLRQARWRPFTPTFAVGYSSGGYGGGPLFTERLDGTLQGTNRILTGGGQIQQWGTRNDFDASMFWRLQNMGFGNVAEIREQRALRNQAQYRLLDTQYRVMAQVVQAQEQVIRNRERVDITRSALFGEDGSLTGPVFRSLQLNFERVRGAEGRPLETLDSIRGLFDLLDAYAGAVTDFERARFRLLFALGIPPRGFVEPETMPQPADARPPQQPMAAPVPAPKE
ncbi:MAG: TolC family protein [Gemmataceae bacterium]